MTRWSRRLPNCSRAQSRKCWLGCNPRISRKAWHTSSKNGLRLSQADKESPVNFEFSDKAKDLQRRLQIFLDKHIYPNEQRYRDEVEQKPWSPTRIIEELKPKARAAGLGKLFLPESEHSAGVTNLEYAPRCE